MSIQHINAISNRLSLRPPQRESVEILARVCEIIELSKDADPSVALVTKGFHTLRANSYSAAADENARDFRTAIPDGQRNRIGGMVFSGFDKCLYPIQKFDSDPERRFAVILENDDDVLKWFKPAKGDFQIHFS